MSQVFEPFIGCDVAEKQDRLFIVSYPQSSPCLGWSKTRVRNGIVDAEWDDRDPVRSHAELLAELKLHLFRVNEDVVGQTILDSQGEPIEQRILRIPTCRIHIVSCEDDSFPQDPVVKHEQGSIKGLQFVVPQDVKNSVAWLSPHS